MATPTLGPNVRNIIVGAAELFVSAGTNVNDSRPTTVPGSGDLATGSAQSYVTYLRGSTKWRTMGYTNNGLEVSYEPGYGDVMVDQLLDSARLFKQTLKVSLKTELTEATLENLQLAFGTPLTVRTYSGSVSASSNTLSTATGTSAGANATLSLAGGALGDAPVERALVAVGQAPSNFATAISPQNTGTDTTKKERVYIARRVVQVETTSHALKRDGATVFPVSFRCLPDDDDSYDGAEYGVIVDRVFA